MADSDDRDADAESADDRGEKADREPAVCEEGECPDPAAVRLSVPGVGEKLVCVAHARALVQEPGVVAEPLDGREAEWP